MNFALLLRGSYVIIEKLVVSESQVVVPRRLKKVVRRWMISPSILGQTTKAIGVIESSDHELHDGTKK